MRIPFRGRSPRPETVDEAVARLRAALGALEAQRTAVTADAGAVLVNEARAGHVLREQRDQLAASCAEVATAAAAADDAAARADADGDAEAAGAYRQAAAGLRRQLAVLEGAANQLAALQVDTASTAARARELVREGRRQLDDTVREQLRMLIAAEAARRRATLAGYRADPRADPRADYRGGRPPEPPGATGANGPG